MPHDLIDAPAGHDVSGEKQRDASIITPEKILEMAPRQPEALHYSGVIAHKHGRTEEGIALVRESLEIDPGQPRLALVLRMRPGIAAPLLRRRAAGSLRSVEAGRPQPAPHPPAVV